MLFFNQKEVSAMANIKPSEVDPSLPDNKAELEAAKDAAKESPSEKSYNDAKAQSDVDSSDIPEAGKK